MMMKEMIKIIFNNKLTCFSKPKHDTIISIDNSINQLRNCTFRKFLLYDEQSYINKYLLIQFNPVKNICG